MCYRIMLVVGRSFSIGINKLLPLICLVLPPTTKTKNSVVEVYQVRPTLHNETGGKNGFIIIIFLLHHL